LISSYVQGVGAMERCGSYDDEESIVRYGSMLRLYAASQYAPKGGYVGYYQKSQKPQRALRGNGPYVAIPPFDASMQHQFSPSCFTVIDPKGQKKFGEELCYGDEVLLLDDQGLVWNNAMGPISYIGAKSRGASGQMNIKFVREISPYGYEAFEDQSRAGEKSDRNGDSAKLKEKNKNCVRYGDIGVKLDVVNINRRLLKKKYTNYVTNFKRDLSKLGGGYLVCDGRGYPAAFTIHHAPPSVDKVTIYQPRFARARSRHPSSSTAVDLLAIRGNQPDSSNYKCGGPSTLAVSSLGRQQVSGAEVLTEQFSVQVAETHYKVPWSMPLVINVEPARPNYYRGQGGQPLSALSPSTPGGRLLRSLVSNEFSVSPAAALARKWSSESLSDSPLSDPLLVPPESTGAQSPRTRAGSWARTQGGVTPGTPSTGNGAPSLADRWSREPMEPVARVVLNNGGRATLWRDELEEVLANGQSGLWVRLLSPEEERASFDRLSASALDPASPSKAFNGLSLNHSTSGSATGSGSGYLDGGVPGVPGVHRHQGSLHVGLALVPRTDEELLTPSGSGSGFNFNQALGGGVSPAILRLDWPGALADTALAGLWARLGRHPGGPHGFAADLGSVAAPWLLGILATAAGLHLMRATQIPSPSLVAEQLQSLESDLATMRTRLVGALEVGGQGNGSMLGPLFSALRVLAVVSWVLFAALIDRVAFFLCRPLDAGPTSHLWAWLWPVAALAAVALTASHLRIKRDAGGGKMNGGASPQVSSLGSSSPGVASTENQPPRVGLGSYEAGVGDSESVGLEVWELRLLEWDVEDADWLNFKGKPGRPLGPGIGSRSEDEGPASSEPVDVLGIAVYNTPIEPATGLPALPERFLLAENGDFAKALERWRGTLAWRKQMDADRALQRPNPYFAIIKEGYPHFYHGTDLAGNVVYYELPGLVDYPRLKASNIGAGQMLNHVMYVQEYLWTVLQPSQDHRVTLVLDLAGLSMSTILNKDIVSIIKGCVTMTSTHYPQRSHKMVILNVPGW